MKKLAIITSHPIQYNAPFFRLLAKESTISLKVFYTWGKEASTSVYDPDFNKSISWDIPLLEGYEYAFVENDSDNPGSHHFKGIRNKTLNSEIQQWGADALLIYGWSFESHLQAMRYFKGRIPVSFRGDSTLLDESNSFSFKKLLRRLFLTWVYKHIDTAFYVGSANKEYFLKHGVSLANLVYAPHAIDNVRFSNEHAQQETNALQWRKQLGISEESTVFLFAGKLEEKKSPQLLLEIFLELAHPTATLLLVGDGKLENKLKELAQNHPRVIFLPFQNQSVMPIVYRLGDVLVLPSSGPGETWGLSINEAMACGRSVVVSDACGAFKDLIKEDITGWGFLKNSKKDLKAILEKVLHLRKKELQEIGLQNQIFINQFQYLNFIQAIRAKLFIENAV